MNFHALIEQFIVDLSTFVTDVFSKYILMICIRLKCHFIKEQFNCDVDIIGMNNEKILTWNFIDNAGSSPSPSYFFFKRLPPISSKTGFLCQTFYLMKSSLMHLNLQQRMNCLKACEGFG